MHSNSAPVTAVLFYLLLASAVLVACWWARYTYRLLWRKGTTEWGHWVYDKGVRSFGVTVSVTLVVIGGYLGGTVVALSNDDVVGCTLAGAAFGALFGLPVSLWLGYFWGAQAAWVYGLKADEDRPSAKRPKTQRG
jgi:hypothetical protein